MSTSLLYNRDMTPDEAIKQLRDLKINKQQQSSDKTSDSFARSLTNFKNIMVGTLCDLTSMLLKSEPSVTVKNVPSNKKVERELTQINKTLLLLLKEIKSQKKVL